MFDYELIFVKSRKRERVDCDLDVDFGSQEKNNKI